MKLSRLLSLFVLLLILPGCRRNNQPQYRIGISQCSSDDWRAQLNAEIMREMMLHPEAEVEIRSAEDSNDHQIADIRYFIDNGFDLIIAAPNEAEPITPIIKEAYDRGIPVITFDRGIIGDSYTAHLEVDNTALGRSAAEYALALMPEGGKVIEIQGDPGMTPTQKRHRGFDEIISRTPGMTTLASVCGYWNEDITRRLTDSLLEVYPDVDLIYAHNDRMAIAAADVARSRGRSGIRFLGIDGRPDVGIKAVADSIIDATFLYPTEGHRLVRTAIAILKGQPYNRHEDIPALSAVDRTNADILLQQNRLLKQETEKIKVLQSEIDEYWKSHSAQSSLLYAAVAMLLMLFAIIFLFLRTFWQHKRHQRALLEQNRLLEDERDKQRELYRQLDSATQSKLVFFTNVSHDLRTPLTLIAEPVERMREKPDMDENERERLLDIAHRNVGILRRLIDQILDFRKYENGKLTLKLCETSLPALVKDWTASFAEAAAKRGIRLQATDETAPDGPATMALDVSKMESVVFNLLSNALKHTGANGRISITTRCTPSTATITVADTGEGIPAEEIDKIFERFYQADSLNPNGSGIGLALSKAFVEMHSGTIAVESTPGKGTVFTVELPVSHVAGCVSDGMNTAGSAAAEIAEAEIPEPEAEESDKPLLLVIDDNADIRALISQTESADFRVITAPDGQKGLRMAAKYVPDLIICDVMMPVMDGMECCRRLKAEVATSHIPVLMLTACSMDSQREQGYASGADSYISKPFSGSVLRTRALNLVENRKRIKELYSDASLPASASKAARPPRARTTPTDIDSDFYTRFVELFSAGMSNPDLTVESLAAQMGLGQSQFSRKIKAITNYTPVELMRFLRLKHARHLLMSTEKTVSEIAYEVGFSSPAYFSKCFRDAFGESASDVRARIQR